MVGTVGETRYKMPLEKIYKCCICHEVLNYKPHRLVHQEFNKRYFNKYNYDFCDKCSKVYHKWIIKHEEEN